MKFGVIPNQTLFGRAPSIPDRTGSRFDEFKHARPDSGRGLRQRRTSFRRYVAGERATEKVLMILSCGSTVGSMEARNNPWEYAEPHHVFVMHGYTIKCDGVREKADRALASQQIDPREYAALFIGGGTGSLLDVAGNARLMSFTASIHQRGGVVGACGATSSLAGDGTPRYGSGLCFD
mgnify:CR=1 FL=1